MALIEQKEAAKQIRQNKDTHEDCQAAIFYNKGCEHSAQIVEQMNGQEIIHCEQCANHHMCALEEWTEHQIMFCGLADKRGDAE